MIEPGEICAGDVIEIVHRPGHEVSVAVCFRALTLEPELLPGSSAPTRSREDLRELAERRTG